MVELVHEARFAYAGFPDDCHDSSVTVGSLGLRAPKLLELGVAANKTREPAPGGRGLQTRAAGFWTSQFVYVHGFGEPLHSHRAQRLHRDVVGHERERSGPYDDRAWLGELLHARREMGCLTNGGVIEVQVTPERPDDDVPRVQPYSDPHNGCMGPTDILGVALHAVLHPERRVACPNRVILVGKWCPEERHDAVAHDLIHEAFESMNGFDHVLEHRIEDHPGFFRVAVLEQLHGSL